MTAARLILAAVDQDPNRPGIADTPRRFADAWLEFADYDPGRISTAFEHTQSDQMIVVQDMRVWTYCEHHLLPFWCDVSIAYIPSGQVLGLSKFARIAKKHAHRLQLQERLIADIAAEVQQLTGTDNVAVIGKGEHLCMTMRGVQTEAQMHSSVMLGTFLNDASCRAEFFNLLRR